MSGSWSRPASRLAVFSLVRNAGDAVLVARIFCFAVTVPALMRLPLPRVRAILEPRVVAHPPDPSDEDRIIGAVLAVLWSGRPLVRIGCLTRGVTLYYFLRRAGVDVSLHFGIGRSERSPDGYDGHCWLVKDGEPYLESRDPRPLYTTLYSFHRRHGVDHAV